MEMEGTQVNDFYIRRRRRKSGFSICIFIKVERAAMTTTTTMMTIGGGGGGEEERKKDIYWMPRAFWELDEDGGRRNVNKHLFIILYIHTKVATKRLELLE